MKNILYADLVNELRSATRSAIVVIDTRYFDMQEVAGRLKKDADITPLFPKLTFNPSERARQRRLDELEKIEGTTPAANKKTIRS